MPQYLSTDPNAGASVSPYLSTDPMAGTAKADESVGAARLRGFKEGATQGAGDLYEGTKEGLSGIYQMLRHPVDTAKAMSGGIAEAAGAVPDVARHLLNSETRGATAKGFAKGASEGAAGVDADASFSRKVGQFVGGTVIPAVAGAGAVRGVRILKAGAAPALMVEGNGGQQILRVKKGAPIKVVEPNAPAASSSRVPYAAAAAETAATETPKKAPANAGGRLVPGGQSAAAPPVRSAPAAIAEALDEIAASAATDTSAPVVTAARKAPRPVRVVEPTPAATAAQLPQSWAALTAAPAAEAPAGKIQNIAGIVTKRTPKPGAVETARSALGAREAGNIFGMNADEVRRAAPGPSRRPLKAQMADLDADYLRRIHDERGFIDPKLARTLGLATGGAVAGSVAADDHPLAGALAGAVGGAALANPAASLKAVQQARMIGMLSGAALPKSVAGNVGALATAAVEGGTTAPIREALRVPTNLRAFGKGFAEGHPDAGPFGKANVFGRTMQGMDEATSQALQRSGLSEAEAQRLLLTEPNPLGQGAFGKAVQSPIGRAVMPFQRIPFNSLAQGINSIAELAPGSGASNVRRALTVGAGAAGAAAGSETDNPLLLALVAALAGPRQIPFALGAGLTAGPKVIERVGGGVPDASWKDLFDPLKPINKPALLRLLQEMGR